MKVEYISKGYDQLERDNYDDKISITIDGEIVFEAEDGLLEENHTGANFQDIHKIPELLKAAYDAGKRGETFSLSIIDIEE